MKQRSPCLPPQGRPHYLVKMFFPWRLSLVSALRSLFTKNTSAFSTIFIGALVRKLTSSTVFWCLLQLSDGHEDLPEGGGEEAVQTLPVYHPRQENLPRAAAAQTHEARERKWPQGVETVWDCCFFFFNSPVKLLSKRCMYIAEMHIRVRQTCTLSWNLWQQAPSLLLFPDLCCNCGGWRIMWPHWLMGSGFLKQKPSDASHGVSVRWRAPPNRQSATECQVQWARVLPPQTGPLPDSTNSNSFYWTKDMNVSV